MSTFYTRIPRPLVETTRVPAKLGTRFGILFSLHGAQATTSDVSVVIHYPAPGIADRPGDQPYQRSEDPLLCIPDKPCYFGYYFQMKEEMLPGEWRMELLLNGTKVYETTFVVEENHGESI